jgi:hypothetical protein
MGADKKAFVYDVREFLHHLQALLYNCRPRLLRKMEALLAKRMCRVAFVALAALCLASIASACAVRVPASEFPAMMLVQPDDSGGANLK